MSLLVAKVGRWSEEVEVELSGHGVVEEPDATDKR